MEKQRIRKGRECESDGKRFKDCGSWEEGQIGMALGK